MPLTPLHSSQYLQTIRKPIQYLHPLEWGGTLKVSLATYIFPLRNVPPLFFDGGQGTAKLITLPAGRKYLWLNLCRIRVSSAGVFTSDGHLGHAGWTTPAGSVVPASPNAFTDNQDLGNGGGGAHIDIAPNLPSAAIARNPFVIDSIKPVDIEYMIDTADGPRSFVTPPDQLLICRIVWSQGW